MGVVVGASGKSQFSYLESGTARPTSEMNTIEKTFYKEFPYQLMRSPHVKVVKDSASLSTSKQRKGQPP